MKMVVEKEGQPTKNYLKTWFSCLNDQRMFPIRVGKQFCYYEKDIVITVCIL